MDKNRTGKANSKNRLKGGKTVSNKDRLKDCCPECYRIQGPLSWELNENTITALYHCIDCKKLWHCYFDADYILGAVS